MFYLLESYQELNLFIFSKLNHDNVNVWAKKESIQPDGFSLILLYIRKNTYNVKKKKKDNIHFLLWHTCVKVSETVSLLFYSPPSPPAILEM